MDSSPATVSLPPAPAHEPPVWLPFVRWLLVLIGVGGAIGVQQRILLPGAPAWAWLLFTGCGLLAALAGPAPLADGPRLSGRLRWVGARAGWFAVGAALLLALAATALLWQNLSNGLGLAFWLLAIVLLCVGFWPLRGVVADEESIRAWFPVTAQPNRFAIPRWVEIALLVGILAAALLVRAWDIALFPDGLQSDEGNNGVEALKWLSGAPYTPYSEANEGQASLFTYLIAFSFALFGPTLEAMRGVSIAVGVLTVAVFYLFARRHVTIPAALAGAALLAFSRWHITFSRIVYELILTPLAVLLLFYFLDKGLRERRLRDFVFAGLALAFGLNTYTGFRTAPIGVGLLILYWLLTRRQQIATTLVGSGVMAVSALVGLIPLAIYVIQRPDVVLLRTRRLNLMGEIDAVGSLEPLWTNLRNYTQMFNLRGDPVAINNLPGEPALALIVAALAGVGLVYALCYWRDPRLFLALTWIAATLPAGILSVTLESPSSRRVIGILPLAYFLAAIGLDIFWRQSVRTWQGNLRWGWAGLLAGLVLLAGYGDVRLFFDRQVQNHGVRMAFSPVESGIARYIAGLDKEATLYVNQAFRNHSAIQFIARNPDYLVLDMALHLPLPHPHEQPVIYILSLEDIHLRFLFEQFYPGGQWERHTTDFDVPLFYTFTISPEQQREATGLLAWQTPPGVWEKPSGRGVRTDGVALPPQATPGTNGVIWSGSLRIPAYGFYRFRLEGADAASLRIDGQELFAAGDTQAQAELVGGFHDFVLAADVSDQTPPVLYWGGPEGEEPLPVTSLFTFPAPPYGLTGLYYPNASWAGEPVLRQRDIVVTSTDALFSPYSIVWSGEIQVDEAGPVAFGTNSDDGSLVYVEGQLAVDNGGQHGAEYREGAPLNLSAGRHPIEIRYFQDGGSHRFELFWTLPGRGRELVPPDRLFAGLPGPLPGQSNTDAPGLISAPLPEPTATPTAQPTAEPPPSPLSTPQAPSGEQASPVPTPVP